RRLAFDGGLRQLRLGHIALRLARRRRRRRRWSSLARLLLARRRAAAIALRRPRPGLTLPLAWRGPAPAGARFRRAGPRLPAARGGRAIAAAGPDLAAAPHLRGAADAARAPPACARCRAGSLSATRDWNPCRS